MYGMLIRNLLIVRIGPYTKVLPKTIYIFLILD